MRTGRPGALTGTPAPGRPFILLSQWAGLRLPLDFRALLPPGRESVLILARCCIRALLGRGGLDRLPVVQIPYQDDNAGRSWRVCGPLLYGTIETVEGALWASCF